MGSKVRRGEIRADSLLVRVDEVIQMKNYT